MLIDHHTKAYIETNLLPQQSIRRLANGSIDYTLYDGVARTCRSEKILRTGPAIARVARRIAAFLANIHSRPPVVSKTMGKQPHAIASVNHRDSTNSHREPRPALLKAA